MVDDLTYTQVRINIKKEHFGNFSQEKKNFSGRREKYRFDEPISLTIMPSLPAIACNL